MSLLSKKIRDGRFLELIRRFLKAGYFEFKQVHNSLSGTPQGGIISPILANIYLHEFDKYMDGLAKVYSKGEKKRINSIYCGLLCKRYRLKKQGKIKEANRLLKQMQTLHAADPMDKNFIRVRYVRFADDFLVCIIGSKALALEIKVKIACFLEQNLGLELSQEKTAVTHLSKNRVRFLGYDLTKVRCDTKLIEDTRGCIRRSINGNIALLVPGQIIRDKSKPFRRGRNPYPFVARNNYPVLDIVSMYNAEIRGLYNYYRLAVDVGKKLSEFKYYHYYSMLKTIARKEKSSLTKVHKKYNVEVRRKSGTGTRWIIGVRYETKAGWKTMTYFNDSLKRVDVPLRNVSEFLVPVFSGGQLLKRINACSCELCGAVGSSFEVHHIRKLKDIVQKYRKHGRTLPDWVVVMSRIRRKTLVVCHSCHVSIHNGKL
jgi:hypothetical protein